jgi:hypothetical protein
MAPDLATNLVAQVLVIGRKEQHDRRTVVRAQPPRRLQPVHARKVHVHQNPIREQLRGHDPRLLAGQCLAATSKPGIS